MLTPIQIITLMLAGSIVFLGLWCLTGLGSHRLRETANNTARNRGEVGSVFKISHRDRRL
jgi:hypothetical protein